MEAHRKNEPAGLYYVVAAGTACGIFDGVKPQYRDMYTTLGSKKNSANASTKAMAKSIGAYVTLNQTDFYRGDQDTVLGRIQSLYTVLKTYSQADWDTAYIGDSAKEFVRLVDVFTEEYEEATATKYVKEVDATMTEANDDMKALFVHWRNQINTAQGKESTSEDKFVKALNDIWKEAKQSYDIIQAAKKKAEAKAKADSEK